GFRHDSQTIYVPEPDVGAAENIDDRAGRVTNQFRGVRGVDLAIRTAESMGISVDPVMVKMLGPVGIVQRIKESVLDD
ncbi:MAG: hypothetical protein AAFP90_16955, partial [Planctomycetota bacterium]